MNILKPAYYQSLLGQVTVSSAIRSRVFTVTVIMNENVSTERDLDGYPSPPFSVSSVQPVGKSLVFFSLVHTNGNELSTPFNRRL